MFDTTELVINMGPQHPSTHGVLRLVLRLDGERVVDTDVVIGYLHRGIEKLCEHRDYAQIVLITDRMDYVAAATNNLGYVETVEKLMAIEVPGARGTSARSSPSCSGSRATVCGSAPTRWTSAR
jgi:NADH-quinone oxidoreductase subunit D